MTVATLDWPSPLILDVMKLHRADSHRLGFFPKGAFEEHARARQILLALDGSGSVIGYLLFRVAKQRAMIAHLCTAQQARDSGVARALVEHLKRVTAHLAGIGLRCRQDYDARHVWAKFGFTALDRRAGRSHDGHELTLWWFEHPHTDLFSWAPADEHRQRVVIDANVFFDLQGRETEESEASKALLADWVQDSIELCVTKEMLNEINRAEDPDLRRRGRAEVTRYPVLKADDADFQRVCEELKPLFPDSAVLRDESDLRQVAYAIAGEATYFVSRDAALAERCDTIYDRYGLHVLHPAELISRLDVLTRETEYRPARIHGSRLRSRPLATEAVDEVVAAFRDPAGERLSDLRKGVLHCLSSPRHMESRIVMDGQDRPVLLGVLDRQHTGRLAIPLLRVANHPLAATMLRCFLRSALDTAMDEKRPVISVKDGFLSSEARSALSEFGFTEAEGAWLRTAVRVIGDIGTLRSALAEAARAGADESTITSVRAALEHADKVQDAQATASAEQRFWPAKLLSETLPTYIVPIRAEWAQHFFDEELASGLLLGLREDLHLGIEGVYYCSPQHRHLSAPARILWYVSKGREGTGSMCVKACSSLREIVVGKAGNVFRRFRRLGVYERRHVTEAAGGSLDNDLMALRFSMTERFARPVARDFLASLDIGQPLQSPRRISDAQFASIYARGFKLTLE